VIIALFTNTTKNHTKPIALGIRQFLTEHGVRVVTDEKDAAELGADPLSEVDPQSIDFMISVGGDGTILRVFHKYREIEAPILGINMGGLGFMADIPVEEVYASLENLLEGAYLIQERLMMEGKTAEEASTLAVNDIVVHRGRNPSLIDLAIYVDGDYLNTFSADGVIIATPNGSTAYSLAAGGPIITPELEAFVITTISPHTISNRAIVLMPKQSLEIHYISEFESVEVIHDGLSPFSLKRGEILRIMPAKRPFRLVTMPHYNYFATLRTKLGWAGTLKH
jgi:NAD+ kinase